MNNNNVLEMSLYTARPHASRAFPPASGCRARSTPGLGRWTHPIPGAASGLDRRIRACGRSPGLSATLPMRSRLTPPLVSVGRRAGELLPTRGVRGGGSCPPACPRARTAGSAFARLSPPRTRGSGSAAREECAAAGERSPLLGRVPREGDSRHHAATSGEIRTVVSVRLRPVRMCRCDVLRADNFGSLVTRAVVKFEGECVKLCEARTAVRETKLCGYLPNPAE